MVVLGVIIPAVLGVGILISIAVAVRDVYDRLRGPGWMSRRAGRQGRAAAVLATGGAAGPDLDDRRRQGLHHRAWYVVAGLALGVTSVWLAVGAWGNYVGWRDWLESIAWVFVLFLVASVAAAVLCAACLVVAASGAHRHPAWVDVLLDRTPLGRPPELESVSTTVVAHPRHARRRRPVPVRPLGRHHVTDTRASLARTVAGLWTVVAVAVVGWLTFSGRIPATPEELDTSIAAPAWIALYVALVVAALVVYRWELAGSIALAVCAALLGLLSSIQYRPWAALVMVAVFAVPAFLHWLAWQRDHHVHHLVAVAAWSSLAVLISWSAASQVHAHFFGPTHPDSVVDERAAGDVAWAWAGATTSSATQVVARVTVDAPVRLLVDRSADMAAPLESEVRNPTGDDVDDGGVVRLEVEGLRPDTEYHWAVEVDGRIDRARTGRLRTMPEGPASFTLAVGACARSGSNGAVFDAIRQVEPLAYLQVGDLHYANIGVDDPTRFEAALEQVLTQPGQAALYRSTSTAYVWDDHDYAADDGDRTSPSRPAAEQVYRSWVPHHELVSSSPEGAIGQAFVAGRVRVVMTDTRSQRTPPGTGGPEEQQMLGAEQEAWFERQLSEARDAGQVVLWAGSSPWIGEAAPGKDTWAGYPSARRRLADIIARTGMQDRLVAVAGDAHMVALDDGTNTDYSGDRSGGFPLLQAAALDRPGSVKGGPYSAGVHPGGGQYGEVHVRDDGGPTIEVTLIGRTWEGDTLVEESFVLPIG